MPETDYMLNKKIGRYEIQELIGEGAMAMVYRAYDPEINRSVACKILKAEHCVDEEYTSRFLREAKAAGGLSHSSIVTVFDVGKIEGAPYIMMELVEGEDLGVVLDKKQKLSVKRSLTIALHLARALDYAHASNIVHRDIKPDNIIVLSDNESIKVADFGIARNNGNEEAQKTQVGSVLGTPRYMSPEQAIGTDLDGRSDLFSVGAILYEMLTGNKAFDAKNMGTLMIQISQQQPIDIKVLDKKIPIGVRQIVNKLLQKSPAKRFQNGTELVNAIISELSTLQEQSEEQKKHKYVPLKYKFTLFAVAIVSVVLSISMKVIYSKQSDAMTRSAVDSGSLFAKFIATETAVALLSEDWISLETFINDAVSRETFTYLIVTDRDGLIRGASDFSLVGQLYVEDNSAIPISKTNNVYTSTSVIEGNTRVFNITTPVLFQETEVGNIVLGLSQKGLDEVKNTTMWLMFFLALITISSVGVVMFVLGGLISKPLKNITKHLIRFEEGDFDARISLDRSDEIGRVIIAFNGMASAIQKRYTTVVDELAQSDIQKDTVVTDLITTEQSNVDLDDATILASSIVVNSDDEIDDATVIAGMPMPQTDVLPESDKNTNDNTPVAVSNDIVTIDQSAKTDLNKSK